MMNEGYKAILKTMFCTIIAGLNTYFAAAQNITQHKFEEPDIEVLTNLTVVDAHILSKRNGKPITGLKKEDLILYEDNIQQEILHFSYDRLSLSVVLLIDVSGSVWSQVERLQNTALTFLHQLKQDDEVAVIEFDADAYLIQGFTRDKMVIADQLARIKTREFVTPRIHLGGGKGGTLIGESLYLASIYLQKSAAPLTRRALIAISDNVPAALNSPHSKQEILKHLYESETVLYGLITSNLMDDIGKVAKYNPIAILVNKGVEGKYAAGGNISTYSSKTGGTVIKASKESLVHKLGEVVQHLRSRYSLGYSPANESYDGKFRKIRLRVTPEIEKREGGVIVLTRQGYYAHPRQPANGPAKEKPPTAQKN